VRAGERIGNLKISGLERIIERLFPPIYQSTFALSILQLGELAALVNFGNRS
jgi:hypothetical protein